MHSILIIILLGILFLGPGQCVPSEVQIAKRQLLKRGEPATGEDLPDTDTHPNQLDQVETAFKDALELADYVVRFGFDNDRDIFSKYFDEGDRTKVKKVFVTIGSNGKDIPQGGATGNDLLDKLLVQTTDDDELCDGAVLSYLVNKKRKPYIVLCPEAFNKKATILLKGADPQAEDAAKYYMLCEDLGDNVSYRMNSLGATLLHEYMHYDELTKSIWNSPIIDQKNGYGPVNVRTLPGKLARLNADSYAYFAMYCQNSADYLFPFPQETLWTVLCNKKYGDPIPGVDDEDPDCGEQACEAAKAISSSRSRIGFVDSVADK